MAYIFAYNKYLPISPPSLGLAGFIIYRRAAL